MGFRALRGVFVRCSILWGEGEVGTVEERVEKDSRLRWEGEIAREEEWVVKILSRVLGAAAISHVWRLVKTAS